VIGEQVLVLDGRGDASSIVAIGPAAWLALPAGVRAGEFDLSA
jgi:hypothetical protein